MKISIEFPDYDVEGVDVIIDRDESSYSVDKHGNLWSIRMNEAFVRSLAYQMLYFIENNVQVGDHVHYDKFFCPNKEGEYEICFSKDADNIFSIDLSQG